MIGESPIKEANVFTDVPNGIALFMIEVNEMDVQGTATVEKAETPDAISVASEATESRTVPSGETSDLKEAVPESGDESKQKATTADPRGIPWVDFYPELTYKRPESLEGRLKEFREDLEETLRDRELLRIDAMLQKLHRSYTAMWVSDCNRLFRSITRIHHRSANQKGD